MAGASSTPSAADRDVRGPSEWHSPPPPRISALACWGVRCGGVARVREMGEVRLACWDSLPPNHLWMVHLLLYTSFEAQMTCWRERQRNLLLMYAPLKMCFYTDSSLLCFILMGSDPDSSNQNQPCTASFAFVLLHTWSVVHKTGTKQPAEN